jgi:hypothetical protein
MDSPLINNSREIINGYKKRFNKYPSESLAQKIENLSGETADWSDADYGEGPKE